MYLQHTSLCPDGKLLVIVGDNPVGLLVDAHTGKVLGYLYQYILFLGTFVLVLEDIDFVLSGSFIPDNSGIAWSQGLLVRFSLAS